jgi:hypothetical protein
MSLQSDDDTGTLEGAVVVGGGLVGASMAAPSESADTGNLLGLEFFADEGTAVCIGELLTGSTTATGAPVNGRTTAMGDEVAGAIVTAGALLSDTDCIVGFSVVLGDTTGALDGASIGSPVSSGASVGSVGGDDETSLPGPASPGKRVGDMLGNSVYNGLRLALLTAVIPDTSASVVMVELGTPTGDGTGSRGASTLSLSDMLSSLSPAESSLAVPVVLLRCVAGIEGRDAGDRLGVNRTVANSGGCRRPCCPVAIPVQRPNNTKRKTHGSNTTGGRANIRFR